MSPMVGITCVVFYIILIITLKVKITLAVLVEEVHSISILAMSSGTRKSAFGTTVLEREILGSQCEKESLKFP